jgi:glycolate oxidase
MSSTASVVSSNKPAFPAAARQELIQLLGSRAVLDRREDLTLYEYDGGVDKHRPDLVVFPKTPEQVKQVVELARKHQLQFVGRGAGTGLSGGVDEPDREDRSR